MPTTREKSFSVILHVMLLSVTSIGGQVNTANFHLVFIYEAPSFASDIATVNTTVTNFNARNDIANYSVIGVAVDDDVGASISVICDSLPRNGPVLLMVFATSVRVVFAASVVASQLEIPVFVHSSRDYSNIFEVRKWSSSILRPS